MLAGVRTERHIELHRRAGLLLAAAAGRAATAAAAALRSDVCSNTESCLKQGQWMRDNAGGSPEYKIRLDLYKITIRVTI